LDFAGQFPGFDGPRRVDALNADPSTVITTTAPSDTVRMSFKINV
jgi:hypothetical protein